VIVGNAVRVTIKTCRRGPVCFEMLVLPRLWSVFIIDSLLHTSLSLRGGE